MRWHDVKEIVLDRALFLALVLLFSVFVLSLLIHGQFC